MRFTCEFKKKMKNDQENLQTCLIRKKYLRTSRCCRESEDEVSMRLKYAMQ